MTINIRGLKESDSDQIVELAKSEHNESYYNFLTFSEDKIRALVKTTIAMPDGTICYVAEEHGKIIGFICGYLIMYASTNDFFTQDLSLYVTPDRRGTVAAKRLIKYLECWAEMKGCKELALSITSDINIKRTGKFYKLLGFSDIGRIYRKQLTKEK
jgi:GNAT superfamily N-acetyltransferase